MKYAISPEVIDNKSSSWILQPFLKVGATTFHQVKDIPNDYILISVHHPPWRSPYKEWISKGNNHIEIDYGYWGLDNPRRVTRRITYNGSHNLNMKSSVPYSRMYTLDQPTIQNWVRNRGTHLLIIEPQEKIVFERTGNFLSEWKDKMLDAVSSFWDGPIKWRRKAGGKKAGRWTSFIEDLQDSHAVIGERTMACVEAVMLGYPAYTTDYSTVSLLMGDDISASVDPTFPDRTQWLEHVAWSQFHPEEFVDGTKVIKILEEYQVYNHG